MELQTGAEVQSASKASGLAPMIAWKRRRRGESGAVIVEFALAFPILLVTFIFICQILNVFTYDVLGSYAAFAAARAYAVHRNQGWETGWKEEEQQIEAAKKAYGAAVAIMATYTLPSGLEEEDLPANWTAERNLGLQDFINTAQGFGVRISDEIFYTAHVRMNRDEKFSITEYSDQPAVKIELLNDSVGFSVIGLGVDEVARNFVVPMKPGYGYPDSEEEEGGWFENLTEWIYGLIPGFFRDLLDQFGLAPKPQSGFPAKVARVSFTYDYPTILTQLSGGYLAPGSVRQRESRIPIFQSCAAPIETIPTDLLEFVSADTQSTSQDELTDNMEKTKELQNAINGELMVLYECIKEIEETLLGDRPDRMVWGNGPEWNKAKPEEKPDLVRVNPSEHEALKEGAGSLTAMYSDLAAVRGAIGEWTGDEDGWLLDPRESLLADSTYREDVKGWCQVEIDDLNRRIDNLEDKIDRLEREIDAENEKEEPNDSKIDRLSDEIDELNKEIHALEVEKDIWKDRKANEQVYITENNELIDGCLRNGLANVEAALSRYYEFQAEVVEQESSILDTYFQTDDMP